MGARTEDKGEPMDSKYTLVRINAAGAEVSIAPFQSIKRARFCARAIKTARPQYTTELRDASGALLFVAIMRGARAVCVAV